MTWFMAVGTGFLVLLGYFVFSLSRFSRKDLYQSILVSTEMLKKDPKNDGKRFDLAILLYQSGNFLKSKETLKPLLDNDPSWKNRLFMAKLEYLLGNYERVENILTSLIESGEGTGRLLFEAQLRLMNTYYLTNQYRKAQQLFGDDPQGMKLPLWEQMKSFGEEEPYQVDWNGENEVIVPFLSKEFPMIPITVHDRTVYAIIDTGADSFYLDQEIAASLGIEPVAKAKTNTFAGRGSQEMGFAKAESLQIGSIQIRSVPVMIVPTIHFTETFQDKSYPVGGVVGVGLLRQFLATIDYPFNRLILRPKSAQGRAAFGKSMAAKKASQVSFALAETHVIIANGEINDREVTFFVDSGMKDEEAFFLLRKETFKYLQIRLPKTRVEDTMAGGFQTRYAQARFQVDKLTLGEVMRRQVTGIYGLMPFKYQELGFMLDGIISHQFLRNYSWTLDFEKRVMYLAKF